jgi:hypothetical protein
LNVGRFPLGSVAFTAEHLSRPLANIEPLSKQLSKVGAILFRPAALFAIKILSLAAKGQEYKKESHQTKKDNVRDT